MWSGDHEGLTRDQSETRNDSGRIQGPLGVDFNAGQSGSDHGPYDHVIV